ncbi:18253_t:CDS:2 [Funneliformis geosporum]|uniref:11544_t:CDS:1 n=1 Tax=Funneliformis geosporum TaxID=1117311 RepID=A0A9W4SLG9_9GLOM|nr:11544_t:CDS:2 [Funneliformis geosporum]CAI2173208.1 18253_t:CDS:2 [Funneliformis geosporum]
MVALTKTLSKWLAKITESKWTKLFVLASITQLLAVIVLESRVLRRNMDFKAIIIRNIQNDVDCDLNPSKDRMSLIIQENAIFMIFQLFQLYFCLNAVINQNTIQIITLTVINFVCGFYGIVQIFEIKKWNSDLSSVLCQNIDFDRQFSSHDIPLVIVLVGFSLIMAFISFKLYQQFGWNNYKKIGADINVQKIYKATLIFVMLLKLDLFFVFLLSIEVFFLFSEKSENDKKLEFTFTLPKKVYYFHMVVTIMIFFLEILAYRSLRKEWRKGMFAYIVLSTVTIVDFVIILRSATNTVNNNWYFFIVFLSVAIVLCLTTWLYAVLIFKNFGKGLALIFKKKENHLQDPEVGGSTQGEKRFIIEED